MKIKKVTIDENGYNREERFFVRPSLLLWFLSYYYENVIEYVL